MHGHHSLLNLDLARHRQDELIAEAARRQTIRELSHPSARSRVSDIRHAIGSSLISIGERLRPEERGLIGDKVSAESIRLNIAR